MRSEKRRDKTIQIRVSIDERTQIHSNAKKNGYDAGDYLRTFGLTGASPDEITKPAKRVRTYRVTSVRNGGKVQEKVVGPDRNQTQVA